MDANLIIQCQKKKNDKMQTTTEKTKIVAIDSTENWVRYPGSAEVE